MTLTQELTNSMDWSHMTVSEYVDWIVVGWGHGYDWAIIANTITPPVIPQ